MNVEKFISTITAVFRFAGILRGLIQAVRIKLQKQFVLVRDVLYLIILPCWFTRISLSEYFYKAILRSVM